MKRGLALGSAVFLVAMGMPGHAVGGAHNQPPPAGTITLSGTSYTVLTGPVGNAVISRYEFIFDASGSGGTASGTLRVEFFGCVTNGIFDSSCSGPDTSLRQVGYGDIAIECLTGDANTRTAWFSGRIVTGDDLRERPRVRSQEHTIIAASDEILFGRLQDVDNDQTADVRSLFISIARKPYPNRVTAVGSINSPWFIQPYAAAAGGTVTAANACLAGNSMYTEADYKVVAGVNQVQWLEPDDSTTIGSPFTGTGTNLANPPAQSLYDLASVTRALQTEGLTLSFN